MLTGASEYVRDSKLSNLTFRNSARAVLQYFEDPAGFALPRENLLDLFDSLDPPPPGRATEYVSFCTRAALAPRRSGHLT